MKINKYIRIFTSTGDSFRVYVRNSTELKEITDSGIRYEYC